ncbi:DUF1800 family protein [Meiothermus sp. QL-1]|uniref:DUF1800 domain-containing protein n=1 Tax=Meiothermus sp. QL-1 TaxID=2058095 RepID=UPI000E09FD99|nr:DUF1800 family protein [Meiothermus sp. QL-1]RDI95921.1 DUF1800 family protein [Meiothermus sp. QL-1]
MATSFSYADAVHLLRRAAARGRRAEAEQLVEMGLEAAVEHLLQDPAPAPLYQTAASRNQRAQQHREITQLWLQHWLTTPTPAAERLVLFWHGHLTSEFRETMGAQGIDFWNQFATFRRLGYGPYGELLAAIAQDPVMLLYLNNAESRKEHPNQNWARELLELYTLGPGHYSEEDILEAARAFTGWTVRLRGGLRPREASANVPFEFVFRPAWHDSGPKNFLGKRVHRGEEVLEILAAHPQTYRFLGRKLLRFYLSPDPPEGLVEEGAKVLKTEGTRGFLHWLFTHEAFYRPTHRNSLIKSPIEYLVGLWYAAGISQVDLETPGGRQAYQALAAMGQIPFDPPSVAGWEGGLGWLAESPFLARLNLLAAFVGRESRLDLSVFMDGGHTPLALVKPEAQLL